MRIPKYTDELWNYMYEEKRHPITTCKNSMNNQNEIWKPIEGYEHLYAISTHGNVRTFHAGAPQLLVLKYKRNGYAFVCLCKNNTQKYFHVHRLVGIAFIPNPEKKPQINHKDLNRKNNHISNLEWCTQSENQLHSYKNSIRATNNKKGIENIKSSPIIQKSNEGITLFAWESISAANKYYAVKSINRAAQKGTISIGFLWEYISRETYINIKSNYSEPPEANTKDKRKRDLTKAKEARAKKYDLYTNDFFIDHGIICLKWNANLHRSTFEAYARKYKIPGYALIIKRFFDWESFKNAVYKKIASAYKIPLEQINSPLNNIRL